MASVLKPEESGTMGITINLPASLRRFADDRNDIVVEASTVAEALAELGRLYPQLGDRVLAANGRVRSFVRIFVNTRDVRELKDDGTPVCAGDTITLVPAIAGG
jgi:molybdopterin converting factor small subunit